MRAKNGPVATTYTFRLLDSADQPTSITGTCGPSGNFTMAIPDPNSGPEGAATMRKDDTMNVRTHDRSRERGSAMIIWILVMVILTLLGVSYLLMAETENRIAENEKLSMQALYFAEAGARQVKRYFDRPPGIPLASYNLANPSISSSTGRSGRSTPTAKARRRR